MFVWCTGIIFWSVYLGVPSSLSSSFLAIFVVSLPQQLVFRRNLVVHLFRDLAGGCLNTWNPLSFAIDRHETVRKYNEETQQTAD